MSWSKRITFPFKCPSGEVVQLRRPGAGLALKAGRAARIFERAGDEVQNDPRKMAEFLETLPDNELADILQFARVMLSDVVAAPILSMNPQGDQLSPDDVPPLDFWAIFMCAATGINGMPVKTKDGETDVESVATFPPEQARSPESGGDGETVQ